MEYRKSMNRPGFTIVELLVVIVVIGILAAITIISYTGIQQRAINSALQSDLTNASQQLKIYQVYNANYPNSVTDCPSPSAGNMCLKSSAGDTYGAYQVNNASNPQTFRLTVNNKSVSYHITNNSSPVAVDYSGAPTSGLIGYYPLDGDNNDHSGNNKNGLANGTSIIDGVIHQAYIFNGVDNYIEISQGHNFLTTDSTMSMWIYSTSWTNQTYEALLGSRLVGNDGVMFFTNTSGAFSCDWGSSRWTTGYTIPLNQWVHLAVTRDSVGRKLYVNGNLFSTTTLAGGPTTADTVFQIGNIAGSSYYFQGKIDDVRIYNRSLSSVEVMALYNL